jgi:hypothetical protein
MTSKELRLVARLPKRKSKLGNRKSRKRILSEEARWSEERKIEQNLILPMDQLVVK